MTDNTVLNPGTGGDSVRNIAKTANGTNVKTQMVMLDVGGNSDSSIESPAAACSCYAAWGGTTNAAFTNSIVFPKAAAVVIWGGKFLNLNDATLYIQVINLASGGTLGTTEPLDVWALAPQQITQIQFQFGLLCSAGIGIACTTTATGNAAPGTAVQGSIYYL
jgi:hypothetical protein